MSHQEDTFLRIAAAILFLRENFQRQPSLEEVAAQVQWSPDHFQRVFTAWAGVSPKKFAQYLSLGYAKSLLRVPNATLFNTAVETGLSGTGRLHDLFVSIEGMTPGEWKSGTGLVLYYHFAETIFGKALVAATDRGVCHLAFVEEESAGVRALLKSFPLATHHHGMHPHSEAAVRLISRNWSDLTQLKLHLRGTPFQIKVWEALLKIPSGKVATYGSLAASLGQPTAARAVGSAVGDNPVGFLIPCHRVIQASGALGGYAWGVERKAAMLGWEAAERDVAGAGEIGQR
jgi:AraC family transcriptional regulator of adaptative response/methylated-DNA-[protein]-cysteine methyltransferase